MSEFDEKLNALLSNPDSMAQIMQIAKSLSGGQTSGEAAPSAAGPAPPPPPQQPADAPPPAGGLDFLSSLDPKMIARLIPVLQDLNSPQDSQARQLLYSLKPYLKPERQAKIERALQLARIIHIGKKFLANWEG